MARSKARKHQPPASPAPSSSPPPASPALSSADHTDRDDDDDDTFEDAVGASTASVATSTGEPDNVDTDDLPTKADAQENGGDESDGLSGDDESTADAVGVNGVAGDDPMPATTNGDAGPDEHEDAASTSLERTQTPTLSNAPLDVEAVPRSSASNSTASRPSSIISTTSSSAGLARQTNRLSLSLPYDDDDDAGDADKLDFPSHAHEGDDSLSALPAPSPSPAAPRRPFSLSSEPETPTSSSSPPASPSRERPRADRRRSSLLASSFAAGHDPTNVGRDASASLTQAVWRQSMGLNSSPAARGLVDVVLHDEEDASEAEHEGGQTPRQEENARALLPAFDERSTTPPGEPSSSPDSRGYSALSLGAPPTDARSRQASIATPHAADGFLTSRYSVNLSSLAAPVTPENPPAAPPSNGIQKLQAEFLKVRERQEGEEGIDWDFWGRVMNDYEEVARTQPRELSRAIQRGIPPALRGMTWQLMAAAKDANLEFVYSELLKQSSPHEKSIARDLSRTFPKHAYFSEADGVGQENLFNVVKAYSLYDDEVGYTQGLQFIVGPLLLNMPDEEAFSVLVRLMKAYDLRSHYTPNMPGLQLRLFQFDRLVEELVPSVFLHLLRQGVKSSMYASQWFLTLFGYRFPLELVSAIFDLVFAEGVEAVFRFAVALLRRNEAHLLQLEFEDLIDFLKNGLFEVYAPDEEEREQNPDAQYKVHEFVREALQVRITPMMLDQFGEEWASLCAAQTAHTAELDSLRKANLQLSLQVRQLEASLAQINTEHCEMVRQVVAARLEREELEDELVKYKLAYADLSHLAASERASTSPLQLRRQSELSIASSLSGAAGDEPPLPPTPSAGASGGGLGGLGIGRGWFGGGGGGGGRSSSAMSASGSQGY
ncbi:GTPase-activating protein [Rhodotorula kratochvilovae]